MSNHLDPLIEHKLRAFARRRRRLIILRGIFAAIAMLLLTMAVVAAVDYFYVVPDWGRWVLSGAAYAAVLIIAWRQCVSWLVHAPDERQLARLVEHAEPRLREDLLSAVELGRSKGGIFDSEQFRELVQQDVSQRMKRVEMSSLLPVALIRRYFGYAFCIIAVVAAIGFATGWSFRTLLLRALLPGANLDRVSQTRVIIRSPENGDDLVAHGDTVRVEIEISGERTSKAYIETFGELDGRRAIEMQPSGKDRFAATVNIGRESIRYRIKAGDALTRKYVLDARERPYVTLFEKIYHFPAYSKLPDKHTSEADGGLAALEGTEVELALTTNQRIRSASLALEQGKNSITIPLAVGPDGKLKGTVPLNASGTYRVHLVSEDTGFSNKFSPENELRAEPDLVPVVELQSPKTDLILSNNELVDLVGAASDDLGLRSIAQVVKVNDGPWKATILTQEPGMKAGVNHRWDLYDLNLKQGDLVTTKLVATDLKGSRGESRALHVTVTSAGFELRRLEALESLRALNELIFALSATAENLAKTAQKSRELFRGTDEAEGRRQAVVALTGAIADFDTKYAEAWTALQTALRESSPGHLSAELVMLGRELARMEITNVRLAKGNLDLLNADVLNVGGPELMQEAAEGCQQAFHRARISQSAMDSITTAEELAVAAENAHVLLREQERLSELAAASGSHGEKWQALAPRLRIALTQVKAVENLIAPMAERARSSMRQRAQQAIRNFSKRRERMELALSGGQPTAKLLFEPLNDLTRTVKDATRQFADFHREYTQHPVRMMQEILQDVGPSYAHIGRLPRDLASIRSRKQLTPAIQDALAESRWSARGETFRKQGDVEEIRPTADNAFVGDLRTVTAALSVLQSIAGNIEPAKLEEKFSELEMSLRVLESGHNLQEILDGVTYFATNERWDLRSLSSRTKAPRDWKWIEQRLRASPDELGKAMTDRFDPETRKAFDDARQILAKMQGLPAWRAVELEMNQRSNQDRPSASVKADAEILAGHVKLALDLLRKPMDLARQQLLKAAPTVSEIAAALAKKQEELKATTAEQAEEVEKQQPEQAKSENAEQLASQQKINQKVDTLKDLLRAEANRQNILNPEQREAMRDADDALAMLKEPPPKAEQALQDATNDDPNLQKADLERATEQQEKLAEALHQIAKHYEAVEQGKELAETRAKLREAEMELGIKEELDEQFAHAQTLAEMSQKDAKELLKELEAKLPENPLMQKELSDITKDALTNAEEKLQEASLQESRVAKQLDRQAQQERSELPREGAQLAESAAQAAKQALEAAREAQKAAESAEKQAEKAGNRQADDQSDQAGDKAAEAVTSAEKAMQAAEQFPKAGNPEEQLRLAERTAEKAKITAEAAKQSADAAKQAQATSEQAAQRGEKTGENQESAKNSAEAARQAEMAVQAAERAQTLAQHAVDQAKMDIQNRENPPTNPLAQSSNMAAEAAKRAVKAAEAARSAAEQAESQANTANNSNAAQQADLAGNEAAKAMQAAQAAAEAAREMAQSGDFKRAAESAQTAAQKAGEAAAAAEQAANAAQQAQTGAQQAAQNPGESQAPNQQAAQKSGDAAQQAKAAVEAAKQAQSIAQRAAEQAKVLGCRNQQLARAAGQQEGVAMNAQEAGTELARAGRHEMRLGNQAPGEQLQALGNEVQETAQNEVPAAAKALNEAQMAGQAQAPVNAASSELNQELSALQQAQKAPAAAQPNANAQQGTPSEAQAANPQQAANASPSAPQAGAPGAAQPASRAEQQAMARALDALDQYLNAPTPPQLPATAENAATPSGESPNSQPAQPGQSPSAGEGKSGEGSPSPAQAALAQATQAAQSAMRQNRAQGMTPGQGQGQGGLASQSQTAKSEGGANAQGTAVDYKLDASSQGLKRGEWGRLPKKLADQLTKGQQEAVAGDYREAVEMYYRVIAEKAKQQQK